MTSLGELNLKGCYKVADTGMAALAHLTALSILNLQECWQITAIGLACLSGRTFTRQLHLLETSCMELCKVCAREG